MALKEIRDYIDKWSPPLPNILLLGDFNFPQIERTSGIMRCGGRSRDERRGAELLCEVMEDLCLTQIVEKPTRGDNLLDLVLVNNSDLVYDCEVRDVGLSDHRMILLSLVWPNYSATVLPE